jgi:hypothetical protein
MYLCICKASVVGNSPKDPLPSEKTKKKPDKPLPKVLLKPKSKRVWSGPKEMFQREIGMRTRIQAQGKCYLLKSLKIKIQCLNRC